MPIFKRTKEINKLVSFINNGKVNIVAGLRRVGKTYLLDTLFKDNLIYKLNLFKESDFGTLYLDGIHKGIRNEKQLDEALNQFKEDKRKIIIIDEIQLADNFVSSLKSFVKANKDVSVFITGSNSNFLSKEIIEQFQGEAEVIKLNPLSFKEIKEEIADYSLNHYLTYGGLPIVVNLIDEEKVRELTRIYDEIFLKDITKRLDASLEYLSSNHIEEIIELIASSSSPFSPKAIAKRFLKGLEESKKEELKVVNEIHKILIAFEDSFLLKHIHINEFNNQIPLDNIGLNNKYYFSDNGFRFIKCRVVKKIIGLCLENAVFNELLSRGITTTGKLLIGKDNNIEGEIDFCFELDKVKHYLQVTHSINADDYHREVGNLINIDENCIKEIVYLIDTLEDKRSDIKYIQGETFFIG